MYTYIMYTYIYDIYMYTYIYMIYIYVYIYIYTERELCKGYIKITYLYFIMSRKTRQQKMQCIHFITTKVSYSYKLHLYDKKD